MAANVDGVVTLNTSQRIQMMAEAGLGSTYGIKSCGYSRVLAVR